MDINMFNEVSNRYKLITEKLIEKGLTISTMESCTGGLIASLLTDTEGASNTIKGSFVTYSNEAKILQGVPEKVIKEKGVYSINTATEMARACKKAYNSNIGVGITGTFSNVDLNNPDSIPGVVYIHICMDKTDYSAGVTLTANKSRQESKLIIASHVADGLLFLLNK